MDENVRGSVIFLFKKDIQHLVQGVCPDGTVDEKIQLLKNFFASPIVKFLPFPSFLKPDRFEYDAALPRCFKCFGTSELAKFINMPVSEEREVLGTTGSGKSHIIAMYTVYLHCVHWIIKQHIANHDQWNQMKNVPIPVYISDCRLCDSDGRLVFNMIRAYCYSWTFEKDIADINTAWNAIKRLIFCNTNVFAHNLNAYLVRFNGKQRDYLYVFDDWNTFKDPSDEDETDRTEKDLLRNQLFNLATNKKILVVLSARTATRHITFEGWKRLNLFSGLSDDTRDDEDNLIPNPEWTALQAMHQTTIDNMMEGKKVKVLEELSFLSGRVPLLVKEMIKGTNTSWSDSRRVILLVMNREPVADGFVKNCGWVGCFFA